VARRADTAMRQLSKVSKKPDITNPIENILRWCLLIVIFLTPLLFLTHATRIPYLIQATFSRISLVWIFFFWIVFVSRRQNYSFRYTPLFKQPLTYIGLGLISLLIAFANHPGGRLAIGIMGGDGVVFYLVNHFIFFFLALQLLDDWKYLNMAFLALFASCAVASIYGIGQFFGIEIIWPREINPFAGRVVSTFGNPNFFASFLVAAISLSIAKWLGRRCGIAQTIYLLLTVIFLIAIVTTGTRSGWLGVFFAFIIFAAILLLRGLKKEFKRLVSASIVMVLIGLMFLFSSPQGKNILDRLKQALNPAGWGQAGTQRELIWNCAWDLVTEGPVEAKADSELLPKDRPTMLKRTLSFTFGQGLNLFELFYPYKQGKYLKIPKYAPQRTHGNAAHNQILDSWSEVGLLGVLVIIWFFWALFSTGLGKRDSQIAGNPKTSAGTKDHQEQREREIVVYGALAGTAGFFIDNLLNVSFRFPGPIIAFWVAVLAVVVIRQQNNDTCIYHIGKVGRLLLAGIFVLAVLVTNRDLREFIGSTHFVRARMAVSRQQWDRAIEEFETACRIDPSYVDTHYEIGNAYMTAVRYDDCIGSQKNAWRVNYGYDEIPFALGAAYYYKGMRTQTDSEKRELEDSALAWELKALEINPLAVQPYNIIAKIYIDRGEMERVTDLLAPATSYASFDAPMWNNLGYAYSKQDKWDEAVFCYTKALERDPAMQQAMANLRIAQARVRSVSPEKALEVDRQVQEHIEAGDRFRREQRLSEAAERYRAALGLDPGNYIANLYLGNIYYLQEDYTNARRYYQASFLTRPDNTGALKNLALTELKLGNRERCIQLFEQVLKLDPKDEAVRKELDALRSSK